MVRDYTAPGEVVAGGCSMGIAARREGRRAILIEAREDARAKPRPSDWKKRAGK